MSSSTNLNDDNIEPNDVVCGTGRYTNPGNLYCLQLIDEHLAAFLEALPTQRTALIQEVYQTIIHARDGRFIQHDTRRVLTEKECLDKIRRMFTNATAAKRRKDLGLPNRKNKKKATPSETATKPAKTKSRKTKRPLEEEEEEVEVDDDEALQLEAAVAVAVASQEANKRMKREDPPAHAGTRSIEATTTPFTAAPKEDTNEMMDVEDSNNNNNQKSKVVVARNRLLRGTMTEQHALSLLQHADTTEGWKAPPVHKKLQAAQDLVATLLSERKHVRSWAKERLAQVLVQRASDANLTRLRHTAAIQHVVTCVTWEDVVLAWIQDPSVANQRKIHAIIHPPALEKQLEQEYMDQNNLQYPSLDSTHHHIHNKKDDNKNKNVGGGGGYVYELIKSELVLLQNNLKRRGVERHTIWMGNKEDERYYLGPEKKKIPLEMVEGESAYPGPAILEAAQAAVVAAAAKKSDKTTPARKTKTETPKKKESTQPSLVFVKQKRTNPVMNPASTAAVAATASGNGTMPVPTAKDVRSIPMDIAVVAAAPDENNNFHHDDNHHHDDNDNSNNDDHMPPQKRVWRPVPTVVTCDNASVGTEETTGFTTLSSFPSPVRGKHNDHTATSVEAEAVAAANTTTDSAAAIAEADSTAAAVVVGAGDDESTGVLLLASVKHTVLEALANRTALEKAHMAVMAIIGVTILGIYQVKPLVHVLIAFSD